MARRKATGGTAERTPEQARARLAEIRDVLAGTEKEKRDAIREIDERNAKLRIEKAGLLVVAGEKPPEQLESTPERREWTKRRAFLRSELNGSKGVNPQIREVNRNLQILNAHHADRIKKGDKRGARDLEPQIAAEEEKLHELHEQRDRAKKALESHLAAEPK